MTEVVNVRFRNKGKVYYFDPAGMTVPTGKSVIVETAKGMELGDCTCGNHEVEDERVVQPLRPVIRIATDADKAAAEQNMKKEENAFKICQQKIREHGLDMKLVDVEYNFEGSKIMFFFTSDGRVDFRELVKDLALVFRTRIELRQIGVRDEAKMLGGLGICGRPFCCASFLDEFQPVSIKMAKTQSLSLNPAKISGTCGRLMCCLKYEQNAYEYLIKNTPKVQSEVETPLGKGTVTETNLMKQTVKVRLANQADDIPKAFKVAELGEGSQQRYEEEQRAVRENEIKLGTAWAADAKPAESEKLDDPYSGDQRRRNDGGRRRRRPGEGPKDATPAAPAKLERAERPDKIEKVEKAERPEKNVNSEKAQKNERRDNRPRPPRENKKAVEPKSENAPEKRSVSPDKEEHAQGEQPKAQSHNNRRRRPRRKPQGGAGKPASGNNRDAKSE